MVGEMSTRIDMEVLGRHDVPVAAGVAGHMRADRVRHRGAAGHGERSAFAEVILHINDDQCAHGANGILRTREASWLGSTTGTTTFTTSRPSSRRCRPTAARRLRWAAETGCSPAGSRSAVPRAPGSTGARGWFARDARMISLAGARARGRAG